MTFPSRQEPFSPRPWRTVLVVESKCTLEAMMAIVEGRVDYRLYSSAKEPEGKGMRVPSKGVWRLSLHDQ